jgi:8-oxo-dGTP pyrophosphatase MutT (NUDIX family)
LNLAAETPSKRAVFARHAASLIVVRDTPTGPELLMGMRGAGHRFMPNRLVFPGGKVDPQDRRATIGSPLRPEVLLRLERNARPPLARALAVAAARELEEESGLSLGRPPHLHTLDYLCRAITPRASTMRFNARFLVVDAAHVTGQLGGSGELESLRFLPVEEALAADIALVTRLVIEQVRLFLLLDPAARAARRNTPVLRERDWESE